MSSTFKCTLMYEFAIKKHINEFRTRFLLVTNHQKGHASNET